MPNIHHTVHSFLLLNHRANVRLDRKEFNEALQDYDRSLDLMKVDGENEKGIGRYPEYADTFVGTNYTSFFFLIPFILFIRSRLGL